jgi:hypothetical protein
MPARPQKITLAEMRDTGVRGSLIYLLGGLSLTFDLRSVAIRKSLGTPPP